MNMYNKYLQHLNFIFNFGASSVTKGSDEVEKVTQSQMPKLSHSKKYDSLIQSNFLSTQFHESLMYSLISSDV